MGIALLTQEGNSAYFDTSSVLQCLRFAPILRSKDLAKANLDRCAWPGGVAAAKPQPGWLFKLHKDVPEHDVLNLVIDPPPRRFAPPLLARRGDQLDLPGMLLPPFCLGHSSNS
jgi:hypothetical protein